MFVHLFPDRDENEVAKIIGLQLMSSAMVSSISETVSVGMPSMPVSCSQNACCPRVSAIQQPLIADIALHDIAADVRPDPPKVMWHNRLSQVV